MAAAKTAQAPGVADLVGWVEGRCGHLEEEFQAINTRDLADRTPRENERLDTIRHLLNSGRVCVAMLTDLDTHLQVLREGVE